MGQYNFQSLISQAKKTGIISVEEEQTQLDSIPFWCNQVNSDDINCCFSHKVGMPQHPATLQPMQYMSHQIEFTDYLTKDNRQKKIHVNKSRQIG